MLPQMAMRRGAGGDMIDVRGGTTVLQTLRRNWWLLALGGVLDALIAALYLMLQNSRGPITISDWNGTIVLLGELMLAAGVLSVVAGLWRSGIGKCWFLEIQGAALCALGMIGCYFARHYRIDLLTVALLAVLMAVSTGLLELAAARSLRSEGRTGDGWFFNATGAASLVLVFPFLALGFRWIVQGPGSHVDFLWLGAFFGVSAIGTIGLGWRLHARTTAIGTTLRN
jgi:uncharacterized membrane protein HdeD (DUF308 family)